MPIVWDPLWPLIGPLMSGEGTLKIQRTTVMKWMPPGGDISSFCGDQLNYSPYNKVQSNNEVQFRNHTLIIIVWGFWVGLFH